VTTGAEAAARPACSAVSLAAGEPLVATASRIEHWLLVEYAGYWPYDPLDAVVFAGGLRAHLAEQLAELPGSRLFLVRRPSFRRDGRVRVVYGRTSERGARFSLLELESHAELADLDVVAALSGDGPGPGEPLPHPLLLVCTHGKRDPCCARLGRELCSQLHRLADSDWVWQSSHVGGDRFAGNVVCLPEGLYFGRLDGGAVAEMLSEYEAGRIALESYRGRSCYGFPVQAAERRVREETGLTGFHDLAFAGRERLHDGRWAVDFAAELAGDRYRVEVALELGEPDYLTCKATEPRRARRWVARSSERPGPAP
jgi:hypothetical protein